MVIAVHVYDGGRRIPPGSNNPTVVDEFMGELSSSELQVKHGGYTQFERPSVPSTCTYGSVSFRCITYSAVNQANARLYTKMMLTGFRDYFISIRIDWSQARQQTATDADAALQAFVPALLLSLSGRLPGGAQLSLVHVLLALGAAATIYLVVRELRGAYVSEWACSLPARPRCSWRPACS